MNKLLQGVVVGCDMQLEWLIPWWWERYSCCNTHPVAFIDFGMTEKAKAFIRGKGTLIELDRLPSTMTEQYSEEFLSDFYYQSQYKEVRAGWMHKPFAMKATPFEKSLWLDLDCEVLADISLLFSYLEGQPSIAIATDVNPHFTASYTLYNGGVIAYHQGCALIDALCMRILKDPFNFFGDDYLLSALIQEMSYPVVEIPMQYNWRASQGFDFSAKIFHWSGPKGKKFIKEKGGISPAIKNMKEAISEVDDLPRGDF